MPTQLCLCDLASLSRPHLPQRGQCQQLSLEEEVAEANHAPCARQEQQEHHRLLSVPGREALQGLPASRTVYLRYDGPASASVPGATLEALLCPPWALKHQDQLLLAATREYSSLLLSGLISCVLSKPGRDLTCMVISSGFLVSLVTS